MNSKLTPTPAKSPVLKVDIKTKLEDYFQASMEAGRTLHTKDFKSDAYLIACDNALKIRREVEEMIRLQLLDSFLSGEASGYAQATLNDEETIPAPTKESLQTLQVMSYKYGAHSLPTMHGVLRVDMPIKGLYHMLRGAQFVRKVTGGKLN